MSGGKFEHATLAVSPSPVSVFVCVYFEAEKHRWALGTDRGEWEVAQRTIGKGNGGWGGGLVMQ